MRSAEQHPIHRRPARPTRAATPGLFLVRNLIVWMVVLAGVGSIRAATLQTQLDRNIIGIAESATLSLVFSAGRPDSIPIPPTVPGLSYQYLGTSTQQSIVNGIRSSTITFSYSVKPTQPGTFLIPALSLPIGGQVVAGQPLRLQVLPAGEQVPGSELAGRPAILQLRVLKNKAYVGEVLPLEMRLYVLRGQGRLQQQVPTLSQTGFTLGPIGDPAKRQEMIGREQYVVLIYQTYVIPVRAGSLQLGPATMKVSVPRPNSRVSIFGDIFSWMDLSLTSDPVTVEAIALPEEGRPTDFDGAVGSFTLMATVSTNAVNVGDPVTINVRIAGRGYLESISVNSWDQWRDFKVYPSTTSIEKANALGVEGAKMIEQVVIPENAEVHEIPPIAFSFFDPEQQAYRTLTRPATPLKVSPNSIGQVNPLVVSGYRPDGESPKDATDIVHIKSRAGLMGVVSAPLIQQRWFLLLQLIPLATWLAAVGWRKRRESWDRNPRLRRRAQVQRVVRDGLASLPGLAEQADAETFFAALFRLLQEQLGERLDLPASAITEMILEDPRLAASLAPSTSESLRELFQACDQVRYAPDRSAREMELLIPKIEAVFSELQSIRADDAT